MPQRTVGGLLSDWWWPLASRETHIAWAHGPGPRLQPSRLAQAEKLSLPRSQHRGTQAAECIPIVSACLRHAAALQSPAERGCRGSSCNVTWRQGASQCGQANCTRNDPSSGECTRPGSVPGVPCTEGSPARGLPLCSAKQAARRQGCEATRQMLCYMSLPVLPAIPSGRPIAEAAARAERRPVADGAMSKHCSHARLTRAPTGSTLRALGDAGGWQLSAASRGHGLRG
jgi:hypothetical protein